MADQFLRKILKIQWGKEQFFFFQQMKLEQLYIHIEKKEVGPLTPPYTKIDSQWTIDMHPRTKMLKFLQENEGVNFSDLGLHNGFLDIIPKAQVTKERLNELGYIKIKNVCVSKDTIKYVEKTTCRMEEKHFQIIYLSQKEY